MPNPLETAVHRRLRRLIERAEPELAATILQALEQMRESVSLEGLERIIASRDAFAVHQLAERLPTELQPAIGQLEQAFVAGGRSAFAMLPSRRVGLVDIGFDGRNQFASAVARDNAARMVREVTDQTKQSIRRTIAAAFDEGVTPRETAKRIRPMIGLTERQVRAVASRRADLIGDGMSATRADALSRAYAGRLLKMRSEAIARTEIMSALTAGQDAGWQLAKAVGLIGPRAQKVWIVTDDDRLCRLCRPMNNRRVPLAQKFRVQGRQISGPPLHPMCRCAIGFDPGLTTQRVAA